MMEGKAHNCEFATGIVDYLYGETSEPQRTVFEEHLVSCAPCTDEFAEIANSRFSVYEWQRDEFAPLATPTFVIPFEESRAGLFAGVREMFRPGWATPALAFAALAIVGGLAFVYVSRDEVTTTAVNVEAPVEIQTPVSREELLPEQTALVEKQEKVVPAPVKPLVARKPALQQQRAVKVDKRPVFRAPRATVQARSTTLRRVPVLSSEVQVDDDASLRLSDLFDSEGTL